MRGLRTRAGRRLSSFVGHLDNDSEIGMDLSNATIAQLMIPVENFDRGVAFYRDVLGIAFLFAAPPQMAFFMCGTVRLWAFCPTARAHNVAPRSISRFLIFKLSTLLSARRVLRFWPPPCGPQRPEVGIVASGVHGP